MTPNERTLRAFFAAVGLLCLLGCQRPVEKGIALEPARLESIHRATETLGARIEEAEKAFRTDPDAARESLRRAEESLRQLEHFYLPLLEARQSAVNAMRHHAEGDVQRARASLTEVSDALDVVLEGELIARQEIVTTRGLLGRARTELESGSKSVPPSLRELTLRLHDMLVKGGLILGAGS